MRSVMSNCLQLHGLQPARLLSPWDFPGKNTGAGCHFLLQGIFPTKGSNAHLPHWQRDSLLAKPRYFSQFYISSLNSLPELRIITSNAYLTSLPEYFSSSPNLTHAKLKLNVLMPLPFLPAPSVFSIGVNDNFMTFPVFQATNLPLTLHISFPLRLCIYYYSAKSIQFSINTSISPFILLLDKFLIVQKHPLLTSSN